MFNPTLDRDAGEDEVWGHRRKETGAPLKSHGRDTNLDPLVHK